MKNGVIGKFDASRTGYLEVAENLTFGNSTIVSAYNRRMPIFATVSS